LRLCKKPQKGAALASARTKYITILQKFAKKIAGALGNAGQNILQKKGERKMRSTL